MKRKLRVLILWSTPSGYMDACMRALVATGNAEVFFVGQRPVAAVAPLDLNRIKGPYKSANFTKPTDYTELVAAIGGFVPDIILAGGSWREPAYRQLLRDFKGRACRVFCSDAQWRGNWRQLLAIASMRLVRKGLYDKAFVAGDRQFAYARRLGFRTADIQTGLYSCDHAAFSSASENSGTNRVENPSFLFVGRLVNIKGIKEMLEGYELYRSKNEHSWPLEVCGTGPLESLVRGAKDVQYRGFVQPAELPGIMASHTVLVVPSHVEPWALVIHEAVSAGMSVICSSACGAGDAFVETGLNGEILTSVDSNSIADSFSRMTEFNRDKLALMSDKSKELSVRITPDLWAENVLAFSKG